jgi:hypothetical protein
MLCLFPQIILPSLFPQRRISEPTFNSFTLLWTSAVWEWQEDRVEGWKKSLHTCHSYADCRSECPFKAKPPSVVLRLPTGFPVWVAVGRRHIPKCFPGMWSENSFPIGQSYCRATIFWHRQQCILTEYVIRKLPLFWTIPLWGHNPMIQTSVCTHRVCGPKMGPQLLTVTERATHSYRKCWYRKVPYHWVTPHVSTASTCNTGSIKSSQGTPEEKSIATEDPDGGNTLSIQDKT